MASGTGDVCAQTRPSVPVPDSAPATPTAPVLKTTPGAAPVLRGLLLVSQDPGQSSRLAEPTITKRAITKRSICREPQTLATSSAAPSPTTIDAMREQWRNLPASASASERIFSAVPTQWLAATEVRERLAGYIGRPLDGALTQAVVSELIRILETNARYLSDVYIPEQTASNGLLMVVVRPALLGKVIAKGQQHHNAEDITCRVRLQAGEAVDLKVLADDLAQLNASSSWRYTGTPEFTPGALPGTTDLVLNTTDEKPLRYFFGTDNTGSPVTGLGRYRAGVNIGNFLGRFDHQFDYTLTSAANYKSLSQHSLAYQMPLEGRQRLTARLDLTQSDLLLQGGLFRARGNNQIASLEWTRPQLTALPGLLQGRADKTDTSGGTSSSASGSTSSETSLGLEYKRIGNSLAFNQVVISDRAPQVLQGYGAWRLAWQDSLGASQLYTRLTLSPGALLGSNNNATFDAVRSGATANYWRLNTAYNRSIALPAQWVLGVNLNAQLARKALVSSERMGLSGWGGVRGYYSSTLIADAGATASFELQSPRQPLDVGAQVGTWYALAFLDAGRSWNATAEHNADLNQTGHQFSLVSHGVGVRFDTSRHSNFRLDLAKRHFGLTDAPSWLWHVSWQVAF